MGPSASSVTTRRKMERTRMIPKAVSWRRNLKDPREIVMAITRLHDGRRTERRLGSYIPASQSLTDRHLSYSPPVA
jgi:hypothetical protein